MDRRRRAGFILGAWYWVLSSKRCVMRLAMRYSNDYACSRRQWLAGTGAVALGAVVGTTTAREQGGVGRPAPNEGGRRAPNDSTGKMPAPPRRFSIVGMIDDRGPAPDAKLRELLPKGVRGLRITPRIYGEKWLEGAGMEALWKCAAD